MSSNKRIRNATFALLSCAAVNSASLAAPAGQAETAAHRAMDAAAGHYVKLCTDLAADKLDAIAGHVKTLSASLAAVDKDAGKDASQRSRRSAGSDSSISAAAPARSRSC